MAEIVRDENGRVLFTKEMKKEYTILMPNMAPIHFELIKNVLVNEGYNFELLTNDGKGVIDKGLKYIHNDMCYPAILSIGQMIDALESGKYDKNKVALVMTQTGGGCRASNYIHLLRKGLIKGGYNDIPVISVNLSGLESNPGFSLSLPLVRKALASLIYGDLLMLLSNQTRPYEVSKGDTDALIASATKDLSEQFNKGKGYKKSEMRENMKKIIKDFSDISIKRVKKVKVGVVGEIYVKYSPLGNNKLEEFLRSQDCEIMVPGLMGFMIFKTDNRLEDIKLYGGSKAKYHAVNVFKKYLMGLEDMMYSLVRENSDFNVPCNFEELKLMVKDVIGYGSKMGEGWLLTAEMMELCHSGYENIVCTQPFGCLPNHIVGKGMIRKIREVHENANIVAIDYDPGATKVNQENRIKLMLEIGKERLFDENDDNLEKETVASAETEKSTKQYNEADTAGARA